MNEDLNRNRKLLWKEKSCGRIKDRNGRLAQGEDKATKFWKEYFEDLYNMDTQ